MKGLLQQIIHNWRVKNTSDPQLQAYMDFWNQAGEGTVVPTSEITTQLYNKQKEAIGNRHMGFSGIPQFISGEGTKPNPYAGSGNEVGVIGFRGGSNPMHHTSAYSRTKYLDGLFKGMSVENLTDSRNGNLTDEWLYHTDKGSYDLKPKWYDWKYRTK